MRAKTERSVAKTRKGALEVKGHFRRPQGRRWRTTVQIGTMLLSWYLVLVSCPRNWWPSRLNQQVKPTPHSALLLSRFTLASPRRSSPVSTSRCGFDTESFTKTRVVNSTSRSMVSPTPYAMPPPGVRGHDTDTTVGVTSPAISMETLAPRVSWDHTGGSVGSASMSSSYLDRTAAVTLSSGDDASVAVGRYNAFVPS